MNNEPTPKKTVVPVAKFREAYDHLLRVVNVDYCACVKLDERRKWLTIASRVLAEVEQTDCNRASATDRDWQAVAIDTARRRIESVRFEIAQAEKNNSATH